MKNFFLFSVFIFLAACKSNIPKKSAVAIKTEATIAKDSLITPASNKEEVTTKEVVVLKPDTIVKTNTLETVVKEKTSTITKTPVVKKVDPKKITINHILWNNLVTKYVSDKGNVNYKDFAANSRKLQEYLDYLNNNSPNSSFTKNEKLAYYINIYNAATVKLILDNYPTKSIKDLKNPWGNAIVKIDNQLISLGDIEHTILRKMNEPRIHFAINCASYSCPKLLNSAFSASKMEKQLHNVTYDFVNDATRNKIHENNIQLSEIFKWYKKDFTTNNTLIAYLNKYSKTLIKPSAKTTYLKYDWSLNER